nr:META domain-containing protein [Salsipaludibacter albus]
MALLACAGSGDDAAPTSTVDPTGREWVLAELEGEPVPDIAEITLTVEDGQLSGSAGCNRYTGTVDLADQSISMDSEVASTMMACPEDVMALEQSYLAAIASAAGWTATDDQFTLLDADGNPVAVFAQP